MSERKYTDEQTIKALECCINADCLNCPQWSEEWYSGMCSGFLKSVLDLINRQKAEIAVLTTAVDNSTKEFLKLHDEYQDQKEEIEKLQEVNADLNESLRFAAEVNKDLKAEVERLKADVRICESEIRCERIHRGMAKVEAIKEFAERLKANMCHGYPYLEIEEDLFRRDIDNLVAEMTEGK